MIELGGPIPPDTDHAVSVSLPTWKSNVGYEEGDPQVVGKMKTGYPRFFIHAAVNALADEIAATYGRPGQKAMLFPTPAVARRCVDFVRERAIDHVAAGDLDVVDLTLDSSAQVAAELKTLAPTISAVMCSPEAFAIAKQYWQHTGDGISSRRAEFCHELLKKRILVPASRPTSPTSPTKFVAGKPCRGPRRYRRPESMGDIHRPTSPTNGDRGFDDEAEIVHESSQFLEQRYGRNLDLAFMERAKSAIKRRIAGALSTTVDITKDSFPAMSENTRGIANLQEHDVYLYPCGMNAIYNVHRGLLAALGPRKSINYGFPYVDTLKILEKFGPGCLFYGHASDSELDDLERRLKEGERYLALVCEFPGNPLLTCPDLDRIRKLADEYDFAVVVDESIGTFANINVLPLADVVVSSLTKIFSGDCNVMGGGSIINPQGKYYKAIKAALDAQEDTYWPEDIIFMERNSRDFAGRIERTNANALAICEVLMSSPLVKRVYYPKYNASRPNFDVVRLPTGGYGGLLSVTFHEHAAAVAFYDAVETAKGPSLGTNFTLTSPYVILAHYQELDWAESFGVERDLLRISVGLEPTEQLRSVFERALAAAARAIADVPVEKEG